MGFPPLMAPLNLNGRGCGDALCPCCGSHRPCGPLQTSGCLRSARPRAMGIRWRRGAVGDRSGTAVAEQPRGAATGEAVTGPGRAGISGCLVRSGNTIPDRDPWDHPDWTPLLRVPAENRSCRVWGIQICGACRFGGRWSQSSSGWNGGGSRQSPYELPPPHPPTHPTLQEERPVA